MSSVFLLHVLFGGGRHDLFAEDFVESAASRREVEVEDAYVEVLIFREKCERPNTPEEVVEKTAVENLSFELIVMISNVLIFVIFVFFSLIGIHEIRKVLPHVLLDHLFLLVLRHQVLGVFFHPISFRMSVVDHRLVDVNSKVHGHWIPAGVLVIDDEKFTVVGQFHEDVVLMNVVVAQHRWEWILGTCLRVVVQVQRAVSRFRNQRFEMLNVTVKQKRLL